MKNEQDTTSTKKRTSISSKSLTRTDIRKIANTLYLFHFWKATANFITQVSLDVSYAYDKMYVVRPQCFIPDNHHTEKCRHEYPFLIRKSLKKVRNENIDITMFEQNINTFKEGFARNYELASRRFGEAITEIDKSIAHLTKIKENLISSENNLRLDKQKG